MTPAEFKQARQSLGLSQSELAAALGMGANGDRTVRKWENGERTPNPIAAQVLKWVVSGYFPPEWPIALDGKPKR